jgi:rod shape-determining protein MreD
MARPVRIWPAALCFGLAIVLEIVPLPAALQPLRPPFGTMVMIYWALMLPERIGLFIAFFLGICLDILHGQLLGQNALTLLVVTYLTLRFHLQIRIFPLWQITGAVLALLSIDALLQVLVEGIAGLVPGGYLRWTRVASGVILWPLLMASMDRLRQSSEYRNPNLN